MMTTLLPIAVVLGCLLAFVAAAAWWQQRRQIRHLQNLLVHNDQSRRALAEQLHALRAQLESNARPARPAPATPTEGDLEQRRAELERLLAASAVADGPWHDTRPVH